MKFLFRLFCLFTFFTAGAFALEPEIVVTVKKSSDGFIVDAAVDVPVPLRTAWDVLTDFDHMTAILSNLKSSRIVRRDGQTLTVRQEGAARFGLFSFSFESEREIRLEPMTRILVKQLSGTAKRVETESRFMPTERGTHLDYHAEIVPDSVLARMFGASFVKHEVAEQFRAMSVEMKRRAAASPAPTVAESPQPPQPPPASSAN
jgi:carbon monoxide dehydrogenase subunit G